MNLVAHSLDAAALRAAAVTAVPDIRRHLPAAAPRRLPALRAPASWCRTSSRLGVTHIHCSPHAPGPPRQHPRLRRRRSRPGSIPSSAPRPSSTRCTRSCAAHGMGIVLDIVPNHMAASSENAAWDDVLAHGPASPLRPLVRHRVARDRARAAQPGPAADPRRPLAGCSSGARSRWRRRGRAPRPLLRARLPARSRHHAPVLARALRRLRARAGAGASGLLELRRDRGALRAAAPAQHSAARAALAARRDAGRGARRLRQLAATVPERRRRWPRRRRPYADGGGRAAAAPAARRPGVPAGPLAPRRARDQLPPVLRRERARRAAHGGPGGLRPDPRAACSTGAAAAGWTASGSITPTACSIRSATSERLARRRLRGAAPARRRSSSRRSSRRASGCATTGRWPGTTGYDFLNQAEALFLDAGGATAIERDYRASSASRSRSPPIARAGKRLRARDRALRRRAPPGGAAASSSPARAAAARACRSTRSAGAIVETIVALPVYRTYVDERAPEPGREDRAILERRARPTPGRAARRRRALDLLAAALLARRAPMRAPSSSGFRLRFVQRFQQLSGPRPRRASRTPRSTPTRRCSRGTRSAADPSVRWRARVADFHAGERRPGRPLARRACSP